jgi:transmembrane sensor
VAASVVLIAGASTVGIVRWRNQAPAFEAVRTAPGERRVIHLSDNSTITLGPVSTLRYDSLSRNREITLDGLADFHVQHDAKHPFIVHTSGADVTDVGTEFVVRAYGADSSVRVAVTEGVVSVANRTGERRELTVHAGEVVLVAGKNPPVQLHDANSAAYLAWTGGTLTFDAEAFSDVARELGRWFGVDIRADSSLATRRVTAIYNNPALPSVLDALSATLGAQYQRAGRTVTFTARPR